MSRLSYTDDKYKIHVECRPGCIPKELDDSIRAEAGVPAESGSGTKEYDTWQFYYPTKRDRAAAVGRLKEVRHDGFEIAIKELERGERVDPT